MLDIQNPKEARKIIRENKYTDQTAGTAYKYVQGNLCILPSKYASDFESFCKKNPKPCPLIGLGTKGSPYLKDLGEIDIRTDVPQYRIWKKGELIDEPLDIKKYWNDDLVTFILGCSMSFELPLIAQRCAKLQVFDVIICLGCVIKGDTPHFDWICQETSRAIMDVALKNTIPVIFGVLTTLNYEQASQRSQKALNTDVDQTSQKKPPVNKGVEFAKSALEMVILMKDLIESYLVLEKEK